MSSQTPQPRIKFSTLEIIVIAIAVFVAAGGFIAAGIAMANVAFGI